MMTAHKVGTRMYWGATLGLMAGAMAMAVFYAPAQTPAEPVPKIFYLHLPVAMNTFVAAAVVFVASIGYLWTRRSAWDILASVAAQVTVVYCAVVLATGMIWARSAWGHWWMWSPRLTFSLMLWLLYIVYLVLRPAIVSAQRRALVCAIYGAVAFVDVPLLYLSIKLLPDVHPSSISLTPAMRLTLLCWFVPVTMLCAGLIWARFSRSLRLSASPPVPEPLPRIPNRPRPA